MTGAVAESATSGACCEGLAGRETDRATELQHARDLLQLYIDEGYPEAAIENMEHAIIYLTGQHDELQSSYSSLCD